MHCGHQHLGLSVCRSAEPDALLLDAVLHGLRDPLPETGEVFFDLALNFFGQAGKFGAEESRDTEGFCPAPDADFPVVDILLQAIQGGGDVLVQGSVGLLHSQAMPLEDGDDEAGLCRKVMMNARLPDLNGFRDVGIAEGGESSFGQELVRGVHDAFCGVSAHPDYETTYW